VTGSTAPLWSWLALAGLGFFHGLNPAMGWLFSVALGLNRRSFKAVIISWAPITMGHAVSIAVVLLTVLAFGFAFDRDTVRRVAGALLLAWTVCHSLRGHRQNVCIGMQAGIAGLTIWSFLMATVHGAGLMVIPALVPLCLSGSIEPISELGSTIPVAIAALAVHTAAMLATMAVISVVVYEWVGLAFLRSGWINLDLVWVAALGACGAVLLLA
jgi:hypothetical protein